MTDQTDGCIKQAHVKESEGWHFCWSVITTILKSLWSAIKRNKDPQTRKIRNVLGHGIK